MSNAIASYKNARVSGQIKYTPAFTKPGTGVPVAQKASIPCIVNNPPYIGDGGKLIETDKVLVFLTAWGKLADTCAKYLAEGKEFSCDCNINSYQSKILDPATGRAILNSAGQPCVTTKQGFTIIPSSFIFGQDSAKQIEKENRPLGWDGKLPLGMIEAALASGKINDILEQAKQGPAMWQAKRDILKKLEYIPGMQVFGEAKVVLAEGAAQTAYSLGAQVAAATTEVTVEGFSYKQLTDAGWTDEQLLASKFRAVVPVKAMAPPPPPVTPEVEVIPPETDVVMHMEAGSSTAV